MPKTALTTGANSGIGLATVVELARRGLRSVGTVRSDAKAAIVHDAAAGAGVEVETAVLDVRDADASQRLIDLYRPDALVSNAGYSVTGAIEDVSDDEARAVLETMVLAPMRFGRLAIPHMRERGWGRIVNVSSIYGRLSTPLTGWYQGAKHALEALSDALRMEVAADGIKVVLVEPGAVRTDIWESNEQDIQRRAGSRYESAYRRTLSLTRMGGVVQASPERVAKVIAGAVTSSRPLPRYLVGVDAVAYAVADGIAPTRVADRVKRLVLGL